MENYTQDLDETCPQCGVALRDHYSATIVDSRGRQEWASCADVASGAAQRPPCIKQPSYMLAPRRTPA